MEIERGGRPIPTRTPSLFALSLRGDLDSILSQFFSMPTPKKKSKLDGSLEVLYIEGYCDHDCMLGHVRKRFLSKTASF